ncbi:MAG: rhodanese-related sulfurtransferase [Methylocystis sp.]|nr:rhodanese-related sulfurtransferase [Methylocystis sp.]MCA3588839.1 rhodanese-related sulfurtransferase [Methylocystis sp.]MCA3590864.1 rhodanese-related sulfurtransferase [Methylocystis sp.]
MSIPRAVTCETPLFKVAAFYRFQRLADLPAIREALLALCGRHGVLGIILIAPEGINGAIAAAPDVMDDVLEGVRSIAGLGVLETKFSVASARPFRRLKVRIKQEIVTIGDPAVDPNAAVGAYVAPADWNALIADPDVLLIDTRNAYEVEIGTFAGAVDPGTGAFGEFPAWVRRNLDPARHRRIAMFCTGGIRCEKATSFMLREGFEEVYHLQGGILGYLERVPESESRWRGGCFVFDERVAVGHGLAELPVRLCLACSRPLSPGVESKPGYEEGVSCPRCVESLSEARKASARERQRQIGIGVRRGKPHLAED